MTTNNPWYWKTTSAEEKKAMFDRADVKALALAPAREAEREAKREAEYNARITDAIGIVESAISGGAFPQLTPDMVRGVYYAMSFMRKEIVLTEPWKRT